MKSSKSRKAKARRKTAETGRDPLRFSTRSCWLFAAGFGSIVAGYVLLSKGSITLAPILLVAGYCALVPLAIFAR